MVKDNKCYFSLVIIDGISAGTERKSRYFAKYTRLVSPAQEDIATEKFQEYKFVNSDI